LKFHSEAIAYRGTAFENNVAKKMLGLEKEKVTK
jgi:hypothetical protein